MNTREKRTQTEPGLGTVAAGDSRQTQTREKLAEKRRSRPPPSEALDRSEPTSAPPISGPPASGGPRHTKALETQRRPSRERIATPPGSETPVPPPPPSTRALSRDEEGSQTGMEDTPFDRLDRMERIRRAPTLREEGTETPRAGAVASAPPSVPTRRSQRPIEGRPVSNRPTEPRPLSSKPPTRGRSSIPPSSGRGGARPSVRPPKASAPPASGGTGGASSNRPAKSARASIRVDEVGSVGQDAVHGSGADRRVPKLLKSKDEIAAAPIDNRAGFLLTYVDGSTSVQGLVDMAVMPEEEVHEILDRLRRLGIIALR